MDLLSNAIAQLQIFSVQLHTLQTSLLLQTARPSTKAWSQFKESDYPTANDFCRACLLDENPSGREKTKDRCRLPIREPNAGPVNLNGIRAAQGALLGARGGVKLPAEQKKKAARKLIQVMREHEIEPAEGLVKLAKG